MAAHILGQIIDGCRTYYFILFKPLVYISTYNIRLSYYISTYNRWLSYILVHIIDGFRIY